VEWNSTSAGDLVRESFGLVSIWEAKNREDKTMPRWSSVVTRVLIAVGACTAIVAAGEYSQAADEFVFANKGADITPMCGDKPVRVALVDGFGGNTWRKTQLAELRDEAAKCPNITEILYADAGGDQQKYTSDINSFVAQRVNIILAFTDFGKAALPTYRKAFKDGVTIVPYFSELGGQPGTDYVANPYQDQIRVAHIWAGWIGKTLGGKGNVILLGGIPGGDVSKKFLEGFKEGLTAFPEIKLLEDDYIVTNWNPADAQKAVTGLIAKYPQIDAVASDYGVTTLAAIKAFEQAGLPIPVQATIASNNELNCKYLDDRTAGKGWKYMSVDGTTITVRFALRKALAAFQGTTNDEPLAIVPYVYADSEANIDPKCDPSAPPDADFASGVPEDKLKEIFAQ
jgi:ribose transport system substrate-binding protein